MLNFSCWRHRWLKWRFSISAMRLVSTYVGPDLRLHVPVRLVGAQGTLRIGAGVSLGYPAAPCCGDGAILLQPRNQDAVIEIGSRTTISNNVALIAMQSIRIGSDCLLGDSIAIYDCDFHEIAPDRRRHGTGTVKPVVIGNNVWLGSRVIVLRGVTIGDNSVVGAGSVVTRTVPANTVAAGVPAKVVRKL